MSVLPDRYDSVITYFFDEYTGDGPSAPLSMDELKQFRATYSRLVDEKRDYIQKLSSAADNDGQCGIVVDRVRLLDDTRDDMIGICDGVVRMIEENLLRIAINTSERVFLHRMNGDFNRYKWEADHDDVVSGKKATQAYYEAMSMCQWNFEPTNPCLLGVALDYTVHLNDMDNTELAVTVLRRVVNKAREYLDESELSDTAVANRPSVESLLADLSERLERYQKIVDGGSIRLFDLIDEPVFDMDEDFHGIVEYDWPTWSGNNRERA